MEKKEIFDKIVTILTDRFDITSDSVTGATNFAEDFAADSIDLVELVLELEDTFGEEIPDDEAAQLTTVDDAVRYIAQHQN